MKTLAIILMIHGLSLGLYSFFHGLSDYRDYRPYYRRLLAAPYEILKNENPEAYTRIADTESGIERTLDFITIKLKEKGDIEGIALISGLFIFTYGAYLFRKSTIQKSEKKCA